MTSTEYLNFILGRNPYYTKYSPDWNLAVKSYYGGREYRDGRYLREYEIESSTASDVIRTYDIDDDGNQTGAYETSVRVNSSNEAEYGEGYANNFYQEKLEQVPLFPYTRLYVSEYNAILFRSPPSRNLPESPEMSAFKMDVNGDGDSINEFMSHVDTYSTIYGIVWVSCMKPSDSDYAHWKMYHPTDVTNWRYQYNADGNLSLKEIVLRLSSDDGVDIYQYITPDFIDTIFAPHDLDDIDGIEIPEGAEFIGDDDNGLYRISQPNELGYVPVSPIYQSTKIHNGVGHTPIFDIAQIQRSVYSDLGEVYSATAYGSHPVTILDTETAAMNDGAVSAEPGSVIRVNQSLNGQPSYVFEFKAPPLDSIKELRELMEQKIEKMNQVAMIRSDELIKASRSGVQIEMFDTKLEAFIRKKAISLENAEYHLWKMWFDWQSKPLPEDLSVSYSRVFSQKGLDQEVDEINKIMGLLDQYRDRFSAGTTSYVVEDFETEAEAEAVARELGGSGTHTHTREDGLVTYMPFATHLEYEQILESNNPDVDYEEDTGFEREIKEKLRDRMRQLIDATYTKNSL